MLTCLQPQCSAFLKQCCLITIPDFPIFKAVWRLTSLNYVKPTLNILLL